jgi:hypothetical protein
MQRHGGQLMAVTGLAVLAACLLIVFLADHSPTRAGARRTAPLATASPLPAGSPSTTRHPPSRPPERQQPVDQPSGDGFLGTVASLSGTVAAILGGFVLAALLSISSERNSMAELLKERDRSLSALISQVNARQQQRDQALRGLLAAWLRAAYQQDDEVPRCEMVRQRIASVHPGIAEAEAAEIAQDYVRSRRAADDLISSTMADIASAEYPRSFSSWVSRHPATNGIDSGLLKDAFDRALGSIERRERLTAGYHSPRDSPQPSSSTPESDSLPAAEAAVRLWSYGPDAVAVQGLRDEVSRITAMKSDLSDKITAFRLPSHLGLGVAIFIFIVLTGVVYPLCLMPSTAASFTPTVSLFIKSCVGVQMIAIVGYILIVARSLHRV